MQDHSLHQIPVNTKILLRVWADDGNVGTSEGTVIGETEKDLTDS
ncbi:MAG: hypothetical protein ACLVFD_00070 [Anaerostipes hadrus]